MSAQTSNGSIDNIPSWETLFAALPLPISAWAYLLARRTFRPNPLEPLYELALRRVAEVAAEGDFLEFGVYRGASFATFWHMCRKLGISNRRFFAFDSFAGLPGAEGIWEKGMYACSKGRFATLIRKAGVDMGRVTMVEGLFDQTLTTVTKEKYRLCKAAIVHIDCDLYDSTKIALNFIEDMVGVGTALLFDDWNCFRGNENCGEPKAFSEWPSAKRFDEIYSSSQTRGFICARR
jgi:hypothetical protein